MPLGLIGLKLGQTRVYDARGQAVPVTLVLAGPNRVLQVKTPQSDGYSAVQLGFGGQKVQRLSKPVLGHLVKFGALSQEEAAKAHVKADTKPVLEAVKRVREFRDFPKEVKPGELLSVNLFAVGDFVDAIGVTKGRGFEGVVRRHRFRGGDSTHGAKGWHRRSGAIGQRLFPGTVMRGMKMPGHLGQVRRTVQNLEVIQVREADHLLLIKGAIPGAKGDYVIIREAKKLSRERVAALRKKREEAAQQAGARKGGAKLAAKK